MIIFYTCVNPLKRPMDFFICFFTTREVFFFFFPIIFEMRGPIFCHDELHWMCSKRGWLAMVVGRGDAFSGSCTVMWEGWFYRDIFRRFSGGRERGELAEKNRRRGMIWEKRRRKRFEQRRRRGRRRERSQVWRWWLPAFLYHLIVPFFFFLWLFSGYFFFDLDVGS